MAYSTDGYSRGTWSGGSTGATTPPGQQLPPPIPGYTPSYTWAAQSGSYPWSGMSWSGGQNPRVFTGGGVLVSPQPDAGTMSIRAWWPSAGAIQVVRIHPDGSRVPVRGAYPVVVATPTRTNYATNPSAKAGLNGYVPGVGTPTLSQITRDDNGGPAWRATIAAGGTDEVGVPHALTGGRGHATLGVDLRLSARPSTVTITVGWVDASGNALAASTVNLTPDQINPSISAFGRQIVVFTVPAGAANCSTIKISAAGLPAGATVDGAQITVEQGITDGSAADGDSLGGQWAGVTALSTSIIAPVLTVTDGECPLDVPVVYEVSNPSILGGRARSATSTLDSGDRTWLTHPATPTVPVRCHPTLTPTLAHKQAQGVFQVLGRANPVVVSASVRTAPSGTLTFAADTFADRDQLLGLFGDGSAVLLRAPADFGYGAGMWLALGDITEDPKGRPAWMQPRELAVPFQVVDPPAGPNSLVA